MGAPSRAAISRKVASCAGLNRPPMTSSRIESYVERAAVHAARPCVVRLTSVPRASCGATRRSTMPRPAIACTTRDTRGWLMLTRLARSDTRIGIATVVTVALAQTQHRLGAGVPTTQAIVGGFRSGYWVLVGVAVAKALLALGIIRASRQGRR